MFLIWESKIAFSKILVYIFLIKKHRFQLPISSSKYCPQNSKLLNVCKNQFPSIWLGIVWYISVSEVNFFYFHLVHWIALIFFWVLTSKSAIVSSLLILLIWQSRSSANLYYFIIITGLGLQNLLLYMVFWFTGIVIIPHFVIFVEVSISSSSSIPICDLILLQKWLLVFSFFDILVCRISI